MRVGDRLRLAVKFLMMNFYFQIDWFVIKMARKYDRKGKKLLDVGAWECKYKKYFERLEYLSQDVVQNSQKTIDYVGEVDKVKGRFDYILCTQVLEHVKKPEEMFEGFRRLLKSGGKVFLTTNFIYQIHMEPDDYYRFTKYGLRYLGEVNGFKVEHLKAQNGVGGVLAYVLTTLPLRLGLEKAGWSYWGYLILFSPVIVVVNLLGMGLDLLDKDKSLTVNYEVIYKKI
ncbi:MAG: methyltransferase domain-containing protein [Candidatus Beckwithbacteria bacterium]